MESIWFLQNFVSKHKLEFFFSCSYYSLCSYFMGNTIILSFYVFQKTYGGIINFIYEERFVICIKTDKPSVSPGSKTWKTWHEEHIYSWVFGATVMVIASVVYQFMFI